MSGAIFISLSYSNLLQLQSKDIANMSKNSAQHKKKVKYAAQVLLENPRLKVRQAMLVALFGKTDIDNDSIRREIS